MLQPASSRRAAEVRLRANAPVMALAFPLVTVFTSALLAGTGRSGLSLDLLTIAAPTLPLVRAVIADALPDVAELVLGVAASGPIWAEVGRRTAGWVVAHGEPTWRRFWRAYVLVVVIWSVSAAGALFALN